MSSQHYRWAWAQPLTGTRKLVLLNLVERANDEGECYPSIARIAQDTGTDRKTVIAALGKLASMGLISKQQQHGNSTRYLLNTQVQAEPVPKTVPVPKTAPVPETVLPSTENGTGTSTKNGTHNPPLNPPITPQECMGPEDPPEQLDNDPPEAKAKPRKRTLPADFNLSDGVRRWATAKGYGDLDAHFESFCLKCQAKGYQYVNWDAALKTAIRDDWAGLRRPGSHRNQPGEPRHETLQRPLSAVERCRLSAEEWARKRQEANVIDIDAYRAERPSDSDAMGPDGGDLWPQVGIGAR